GGGPGPLWRVVRRSSHENVQERDHVAERRIDDSFTHLTDRDEGWDRRDTETSTLSVTYSVRSSTSSGTPTSSSGGGTWVWPRCWSSALIGGVPCAGLVPSPPW